MSDKTLAERTIDRLDREIQYMLDNYDTIPVDPELLALAEQALDTSDNKQFSDEEWAEMGASWICAGDVEQWAQDIAIAAMEETLRQEQANVVSENTRTKD